jgi:hypothetical protein
MRLLPIMATSIAVGIVASARSASAQPVAPVYPYPSPYPTYGQPLVPHPRLRYEPGQLPPPGYHLESNPRKGFVISGTITFAVPYAVSATIGMVSQNKTDLWLLVPVVGPVGALANGRAECQKVDRRDCTAETLIAIGLGFDIALQTAGALLFTTGFVFPKKEWVGDYEVVSRETPLFRWSLVPRIDAEGRVGFDFAGTMF